MASGFLQEAPELENTFQSDRWLQACLRLRMGELYEQCAPRLREFGAACAGPIARLGREAESQPPRLVPYDAWGRRIDEIAVSRAWHDLESLAVREGLVLFDCFHCSRYNTNTGRLTPAMFRAVLQAASEHLGQTKPAAAH